MRVYVARHGETTWNLAGRYQGRRESALTALGMRQAFALAGAMDALAIGRVVASPLLRCTATAKPTAERLNLRVETDDRLLEIAHGTWEGRMRDEIAANDGARYRAWRENPDQVAFDGGETPHAVLARWRDFAGTLRPAMPTLVVTHDAVVRVALLDGLGADVPAFWRTRVENGAYAVFEVEAERWTLLEERVDAHLTGLRADTGTQAL
ncbi:MAG TPA: histidine phosphatase family protein [Candidatus Sulfotelmatobacter sp.]|nr:histidine phosphatase family protein [Candidatus Sulfotelmatobacter sp.]